MKSHLAILLLLVTQTCFSQKEIDLSGLKKIPYKPAVQVNAVRQVEKITYDSLMKYGLQVVTEDTRFKVVQFDVMYDCHSGRSLVDFSEKRYMGDKIPAGDQFLKSRVLAGYLIDIYNVVIVNGNEKYVMADISFLVVK